MPKHGNTKTKTGTSTKIKNYVANQNAIASTMQIVFAVLCVSVTISMFCGANHNRIDTSQFSEFFKAEHQVTNHTDIAPNVGDSSINDTQILEATNATQSSDTEGNSTSSVPLEHEADDVIVVDEEGDTSTTEKVEHVVEHSTESSAMQASGEYQQQKEGKEAYLISRNDVDNWVSDGFVHSSAGDLLWFRIQNPQVAITELMAMYKEKVLKDAREKSNIPHTAHAPVNTKPTKSLLTIANVFYAIGALLCIGAFTFFMALGWALFGPAGLSLVTALLAGGFFYVGHILYFDQGREIPGALMTAVSVSATPLIVYGLMQAVGIESKQSFFTVRRDRRFVPLELAFVASAAFCLHRINFSVNSIMLWVGIVFLCRDVVTCFLCLPRIILRWLSFYLQLGVLLAICYYVTSLDGISYDIKTSSFIIDTTLEGETVTYLTFISKSIWWGVIISFAGLIAALEYTKIPFRIRKNEYTNTWIEMLQFALVLLGIICGLHNWLATPITIFLAFIATVQITYVLQHILHINDVLAICGLLCIPCVLDNYTSTEVISLLRYFFYSVDVIKIFLFVVAIIITWIDNPCRPIITKKVYKDITDKELSQEYYKFHYQRNWAITLTLVIVSISFNVGIFGILILYALCGTLLHIALYATASLDVLVSDRDFKIIIYILLVVSQLTIFVVDVSFLRVSAFISTYGTTILEAVKFVVVPMMLVDYNGEDFTANCISKLEVAIHTSYFISTFFALCYVTYKICGRNQTELVKLTQLALLIATTTLINAFAYELPQLAIIAASCICCISLSLLDNNLFILNAVSVVCLTLMARANTIPFFYEVVTALESVIHYPVAADLFAIKDTFTNGLRAVLSIFIWLEITILFAKSLRHIETKFKQDKTPANTSNYKVAFAGSIAAYVATQLVLILIAFGENSVTLMGLTQLAGIAGVISQINSISKISITFFASVFATCNILHLLTLLNQVIIDESTSMRNFLQFAIGILGEFMYLAFALYFAWFVMRNYHIPGDVNHKKKDKYALVVATGVGFYYLFLSSFGALFPSHGFAALLASIAWLAGAMLLLTMQYQHCTPYMLAAILVGAVGVESRIMSVLVILYMVIYEVSDRVQHQNKRIVYHIIDAVVLIFVGVALQSTLLVVIGVLLLLADIFRLACMVLGVLVVPLILIFGGISLVILGIKYEDLVASDLLANSNVKVERLPQLIRQISHIASSYLLQLLSTISKVAGSLQIFKPAEYICSVNS